MFLSLSFRCSPICLGLIGFKSGSHKVYIYSLRIMREGTFSGNSPFNQQIINCPLWARPYAKLQSDVTGMPGRLTTGS